MHRYVAALASCLALGVPAVAAAHDGVPRSNWLSLAQFRSIHFDKDASKAVVPFTWFTYIVDYQDTQYFVTKYQCRGVGESFVGANKARRWKHFDCSFSARCDPGCPTARRFTARPHILKPKRAGEYVVQTTDIRRIG